MNIYMNGDFKSHYKFILNLNPANHIKQILALKPNGSMLLPKYFFYLIL